MKELTIINPYPDQTLEYNENTKQYQLKLSFCKEEYESNFNDDATLEKRIKRNYLKNKTPNVNQPVVEFLLTRTEEGRNFIKDILVEQMYADVEYAYNDLGATPAINVTNGQIIDREEIKRNKLSVDAEEIANQSIAYFGFNIFYQGQFPT